MGQLSTTYRTNPIILKGSDQTIYGVSIFQTSILSKKNIKIIPRIFINHHLPSATVIKLGTRNYFKAPDLTFSQLLSPITGARIDNKKIKIIFLIINRTQKTL